MKRRNFLVGLGSITGGGALATGSGAFGGVEATRDISVAVENDRSAYLALTPTASDFSSESDELILRFSFDGQVSPPGGTNEDTGDGVAPNSVYEFNNLFKAENNGPDNIVIFGQGTTENQITTEIITQGRENPLTPENPSKKILTPGGDQIFGLQLRVGDVNPPQVIETSVSITAVTEDSERFPDAFS